MRLQPPFFIAGEVGKSLGVQLVPFGVAGVDDAVLSLRSMGTGTFSFSLPADSPAVPERDQVVSLFDSTGARLFTGRVRLKYVWNGGVAASWSVVVSDAFKQLEETPLVGPVTDDVGAVSIRPMVAFPTQDLRQSIIGLLGIMRQLGVALQAGQVDPCFPVARMVFTKSTGAEALADMLKFIPDGMGWISYEGEGLPRFNVARRRTARNITLHLGADTDDTLEFDIEDFPELRPLSVEVESARRTATGQVVFEKQVAGDPAVANARRQTVVISGQENSESSLRAFENYTIQTVQVVPPNITSGLVLQFDSALAAIAAQHGSVPGGPVTSVPLWTGISKGGSYYDPLIFSNPSYAGPAPSAAGYFILISPTPPDWAIQQYGLFELAITGTWAATTTYPNGGSPSPSDAWTAMAATKSGDYWATGPGSPDTSRAIAGYRLYSLKVWAGQVSFPSALTVYRSADYEFLFPPATLARDLFEAQNFVPWAGRATLGPRSPIFPVPGDTLSALGGDPLWATASAHVEETVFDLRKLSADIRLGTPPLTSPSTLLDRFRSAARDNLAT